jgi:hypothetical protein
MFSLCRQFHGQQPNLMPCVLLLPVSLPDLNTQVRPPEFFIVCFMPIRFVDNFDIGALRAEWFWHRARSDAIHPPAFVNNPNFRS